MTLKMLPREEMPHETHLLETFSPLNRQRSGDHRVIRVGAAIAVRQIVP
jgi:hypothetical protein